MTERQAALGVDSHHPVRHELVDRRTRRRLRPRPGEQRERDPRTEEGRDVEQAPGVGTQSFDAAEHGLVALSWVRAR